MHNSEKSVIGTKHYFEKINFPIPIGATESDAYLKAPRLFSDKYMLFNIWRLSEYGMIVYSLALCTSLEKEIRDFYSELLSLNITLYNEASELTLKKGIDVSAPSIPIPEKVELATKESMFKGLIGDPRTINSIEIKEIVFSLVGMINGHTMLTGFGQVAQLSEIQKHFIKGREICDKQRTILQNILMEEDLPAIPTFETGVTDSIEPPLSDKVMLTLVLFLSQLVFSRYGIAVSQCSRADIATTLSRLMAEFATYGKDGTDIMIAHKWLEQPPSAINREKLIHQ